MSRDKMKSKLIFIIVLLVVFSCSCKNRSIKSDNNVDYFQNTIISDINREYLELKNRVDSNLTTHFPDNLDATNILFSGPAMSQYNFHKLIVVNRISETGLNDKYLADCNASYSGDDPCVLTFQKFSSFREYPEDFRECFVDKFPIPDFRGYDFIDVTTESYLPSDFQIYVIEAEPNEYIPDSLVVSNKTLLAKWEKGFSKGVAISEERMIIIYWLIMW